MLIRARFPARSSHRDDVESVLETEFEKPAGAVTGAMLPTGSPQDDIDVDGVRVSVSVIDIAHPYVFVTRQSLDGAVRELNQNDSAVVESIRCRAAVLMGVVSDVAQASTEPALPRIVVIEGINGTDTAALQARVTAFSMGVAIDSVPVTAALCLVGSSQVPGTIAYVPVSAVGRTLVAVGVSGSVLASSKIVDGRLSSVSVLRTVRTLIHGTAHVTD
jgi:hypothetical protein